MQYFRIHWITHKLLNNRKQNLHWGKSGHSVAVSTSKDAISKLKAADAGKKKKGVKKVDKLCPLSDEAQVCIQLT